MPAGRRIKPKARRRSSGESSLILRAEEVALLFSAAAVGTGAASSALGWACRARALPTSEAAKFKSLSKRSANFKASTFLSNSSEGFSLSTLELTAGLGSARRFKAATSTVSSESIKFGLRSERAPRDKASLVWRVAL